MTAWIFVAAMGANACLMWLAANFRADNRR